MLSGFQQWSYCHGARSNDLGAQLRVYLHDFWLLSLRLFTFTGGRVHP